MKIWVDGQCLQTASSGRGIGRYVTELLRALAQHNEDIELVIGLNGSLAQEAVAARDYLSVVVPGCQIVIWYGIAHKGEFFSGYDTERMSDEQILAAHINDIDPDIALSASPFEGTLDRSSPFIKTEGVKALTACIFYDAIPYRYPDVYLSEESARNLYIRRFNEIVSFDLVMCISDFTNSECREIYGIENTVAIGAGLSETFLRQVADWVACPDSIGAQLGQYVLYVGGLDWRKNVSSLVQAMSSVPQATSGELKLVLAGDNDEEFIQPLRKTWEDLGLDPANFVSTGYITDSELVDLLKNATVTVQPSRMEGFGLVALEAWACGSPFLSARGGAVAEIVDREDFLFDPDIPDTLTKLIIQTLEDENFRAGQLAHGSQGFSRFTWEKTVQIAHDALVNLIVKAGRQPNPRRIVDPLPTSGRMLVDVSATAQSPIVSGIQRVMYNLVGALQDLNGTGPIHATLSYCRDIDGWYEMTELSKTAVRLSPFNRLTMQPQDRYLLLDSSWTFIEGQKVRLLDALVEGQQVVNGVYDIGPLTMPAMTNEGMPPAFRAWFEFILGYSTGIVCISRAVADEIYELLEGIRHPRPMKIGYFPLGADFSNAPADQTGLEMFDTRPTFLMVGTIEPRKGHLVALRAFERLWRKGHDVNLVILGKAGWDTEMIVELLQHHSEAGERLFWINNASDGMLRAAYERASALIMASYLEGFGLPVVEAGKFHTPVILSDLPVFREVGVGAPWAGYFRPADAKDLFRVVREFLETEIDTDNHAYAPWPDWNQSARRMKEIVFGDDWYREYEPSARTLNTRLEGICDIRMTKALAPPYHDKATMRIIEGPFVSDAGTTLRAVVSLVNETDVVWSSLGTNDGQLGINLSYHIYDMHGVCISYDNPRINIPFILLPGHEILLPVRIPISWISRGAFEVGVELVQEGISWFANEVRFDLLEVQDRYGITELNIPSIEPTGDELQFMLSNSQLIDGPNRDPYLVVSVLNKSNYPIQLEQADGLPILTVGLHENGTFSDGTMWIVAHAKTIAPNNFGYICVFAGTDWNPEAVVGALTIRYKLPNATYEWTLGQNKKSFALTKIERIDVRQEDLLLESDLIGSSAALEASDQTLIDLDTGEENEPTSIIDAQVFAAAQTRHTLYLSQDTLGEHALRGFNAPEAGHVWMCGPVGDIRFPTAKFADHKLLGVVVVCQSVPQQGHLRTLTLSVGNIQTEKKGISQDTFMRCEYAVPHELADSFSKEGVLSLKTEDGIFTPGDSRKLAIALTEIELIFGSSPALLHKSDGRHSSPGVGVPRV